jgi:hypothetical protein
MRDADTELLSRYLDGDLSDPEARALSQRLAGDGELARRLEEMRVVRDAVASIASTMEAPEALDALVEPLRQAVPPSRRRPPVVHWLAAAAAAVLGITAVIEIGRHQSGPPVPEPAAPPAAEPRAPGEYFKLHPLPTTSVPPEEEHIGAVEQLVASPPAEPSSDASQPVDVIGPLPLPGTATEGGEPSDQQAAPPSSAKATQDRSGADSWGLRESTARAAPPMRGDGGRSRDDAREHRKALSESDLGEAVLVISADSGVVTIRCPAVSGLDEEGVLVSVVIEGGAIRGCTVVGHSTKRVTSCQELIGTAAPGVDDGAFSARLAAR